MFKNISNKCKIFYYREMANRAEGDAKEKYLMEYFYMQAQANEEKIAGGQDVYNTRQALSHYHKFVVLYEKNIKGKQTKEDPRYVDALYKRVDLFWDLCFMENKDSAEDVFAKMAPRLIAELEEFVRLAGQNDGRISFAYMKIASFYELKKDYVAAMKAKEREVEVLSRKLPENAMSLQWALKKKIFMQSNYFLPVNFSKVVLMQDSLINMSKMHERGYVSYRERADMMNHRGLGDDGGRPKFWLITGRAYYYTVRRRAMLCLVTGRVREAMADFNEYLRCRREGSRRVRMKIFNETLTDTYKIRKNVLTLEQIRECEDRLPNHPVMTDPDLLIKLAFVYQELGDDSLVGHLIPETPQYKVVEFEQQNDAEENSGLQLGSETDRQIRLDSIEWNKFSTPMLRLRVAQLQAERVIKRDPEEARKIMGFALQEHAEEDSLGSTEVLLTMARIFVEGSIKKGEMFSQRRFECSKNLNKAVADIRKSVRLSFAGREGQKDVEYAIAFRELKVECEIAKLYSRAGNKIEARKALDNARKYDPEEALTKKLRVNFGQKMQQDMIFEIWKSQRKQKLQMIDKSCKPKKGFFDTLIVTRDRDKQSEEDSVLKFNQ